MYAFHSSIVCKPGFADDYQARATDPAQGLVEAAGFQRRVLLRSLQDQNLFFHVSSWRAEADAVAFRNSARAVKWREGRDLSVFVETMHRTPVTILQDRQPTDDQSPPLSDQNHIALLFDPTHSHLDAQKALYHVQKMQTVETAIVMSTKPLLTEAFLIQAAGRVGASDTLSGVHGLASQRRTPCRLVVDDHGPK